MKNYYFIASLCALSCLITIVFSDVGNPPKQMIYEITLLEAFSMSGFFFSLWFMGFRSGQKSKEE